VPPFSAADDHFSAPGRRVFPLRNNLYYAPPPLFADKGLPFLSVEHGDPLPSVVNAKIELSRRSRSFTTMASDPSLGRSCNPDCGFLPFTSGSGDPLLFQVIGDPRVDCSSCSFAFSSRITAGIAFPLCKAGLIGDPPHDRLPAILLAKGSQVGVPPAL